MKKKVYGIATLVIFIGAVVISVFLLSKHKPIEIIKLNDSNGKIQNAKADLPLTETVQSVNEFGFSLFKDMLKERENILICPPAMYQAVGALYEAAEGDTKFEIGKVLNASNYSSLEIKKLLQGVSSIDITNSLWVNEKYRNSIKKDYSELLKTNYFTSFSALDFSKPLADVTMNDFVYSNTKGIFDRAVEAQNIKNNNMFLINTATASIDFATQFDFRNTKGADFTLADRITKVYMLSKKDKLLYAENNLLSLVTFPLTKNNWDLHIIMPKENLIDTVNFLSADNFNELLNSRQEKNIQLVVPQMNIGMQKSNIAAAMQGLGMNKVFDKNLADFKTMLDINGFYADNVIHKTSLAENTVVSSNISSSYTSGELINFSADRPFIIVITDRKTGVCTFIGFMYQPE